MVVSLPWAIAIQLLCGNLVQVHEGNAFLGSNLHLPLGMRLTHNLSFLVVGITWCQRHQDRITTSRAYIFYISPHIPTVGQHRLLLSCLLDSDVQRIISCPRDTGSGTPRVIRSVVVMPYRDNHPVARADSLADWLPQFIIKGTTAHTAKCLILNGNLCWVKILMSIIAPTPLTIISIA